MSGWYAQNETQQMMFKCGHIKVQLYCETINTGNEFCFTLCVIFTTCRSEKWLQSLKTMLSWSLSVNKPLHSFHVYVQKRSVFSRSSLTIRSLIWLQARLHRTFGFPSLIATIQKNANAFARCKLARQEKIEPLEYLYLPTRVSTQPHITALSFYVDLTDYHFNVQTT